LTAGIGLDQRFSAAVGHFNVATKSQTGMI